MNLSSNYLILRLMVLALIITAIAGCKPKRKWEVAYFEIEAKPIETPIAEYKLRHPVDTGSFEFSFKRVQVDDPNAAAPPQKLAIVYSVGAKDGDWDDCTGFFVSKRDFLTARHCVPVPEKDSESSEISVSFGQAGNKPARCFRSGLPVTEDWKDWAICSFGEDLNLGDTFTLTTCPPKPATKVMIMGFCKLVIQEGTPYYTSARAETPNAGVLEALSPAEGFLPAQPLDGESTQACPLDSGGPAFIPESLTKVGDRYTPSGKIRVFGIISGPGKCPSGEKKRTCIAPTTDASFLSFLEEKRAGTTTVLGCEE